MIKISTIVFSLLVMLFSVTPTSCQIIERFTFANVYNQVKNSVITLRVSGTALVNGQPKTIDGSGSGVVWDENGYIVTNKHVIEEDSVVNGVKIERRASKIFIVLSGGVEIKASLIGVSPDTDLALLRSDEMRPEFKPMVLDDSDKIIVGDPVLAIGSPFGLGDTLTTGIISAVRSIAMNGDKPFPHQMIQTDAAINPGNSGGALVNLEGKMVGIPTMIISQSGTNAGVGFAIPVSVVKKIVEDIINKRSGTGFLGISVQNIAELSGTIRKQLGVTEEKGVMVTGLILGGPAEKSTITQGDVILEINGAKLEESNGFKWSERNLRPGEDAVLKIKRKKSGVIEEIKIKAGKADNKTDQK